MALGILAIQMLEILPAIRGLLEGLAIKGAT
jgi:hypothetical protein